MRDNILDRHFMPSETSKCQEWVTSYQDTGKRGPQAISKFHGLFLKLFVTLHNRDKALVLKTTYLFSIIIVVLLLSLLFSTEKSSWYSAEASSLLNSVHGARRHFAYYWRRREIINFTQWQTLQPTVETCHLQDILVH